MSRDPNTGVYTLPTLPRDGQTIEAQDVNAPFNDIKDAMNQALPLTHGGTGATSAAAARTALGVADKQDHSSVLDLLSGFQPSANRVPIATASDVISHAYLNNRTDLGGSNPDTSGLATEASIKAYADGRYTAAVSAAQTYANSRTPAAGSALGLAKSSDDIAFSNGQGTIKNNRVGYDELNAGTGTAGQALVRTSGGIGFATIGQMVRAAAVSYAETMEWTDLPPGIAWLRMSQSAEPGVGRSIGPGNGDYTAKVEAGTEQGWTGTYFSTNTITLTGNAQNKISIAPFEKYADEDNFGLSAPLTRLRVVYSGPALGSTYTGYARLFYMVGA